MLDISPRTCRRIAIAGLALAAGAASLATSTAWAQGYRDGDRGYDRPDYEYGGYGPRYAPRYGRYSGFYPSPYYAPPAYGVAPPLVYLPPRVVMAPRIIYAAPMHRTVHHVVARHVAATKPCLCRIGPPALPVSLPPIMPPIRVTPMAPAAIAPASNPPVFLEPRSPFGD